MTRPFDSRFWTYVGLLVSLLAFVWVAPPSTALANGRGHWHHSGVHHGWGGGFYGHHHAWYGHRGYGFRQAPYWGYGQRWMYGYGMGYRPAWRNWYYVPSYGWNPWLGCAGYGYGWNWPTVYSGTGLYLHARPFVPAWRVRAAGVWGVPFADADAAPALDLDEERVGDRVRLVELGPAPLPPDDVVAVKEAPVRDLVYPVVRESSNGARRRAEAYVDLGDRLFRQGQQQAALAQYKLAATASSDWGAPYYRQAIAAVAMQQYDEAAALMRRAVNVDPRYVHGDFRLDTMYGDRRLAKQEHQENLAEVAIEQPARSELVYLIGVLLHFDGESERSQKFFAHAVRLRGDAASVEIAAFLRASRVAIASRELDL